MKESFSQYVSRNDMQNFMWGSCPRCGESVVLAMVKMKNHSFEPKPVAGAGTEINPVYDRHFCAKTSAD